MEHPKLIFGAFQFDRKGQENQKRLLEACEVGGITEIDSGIIYEHCEPILASFKVAERFIVHGKCMPSDNSKAGILQSAEQSTNDLGFSRQGNQKFEYYYLHAPDPVTPIQESYDAIQSLYEAGVFTKFGLSNFKPHDVEKIYEYGKSMGYVLPTAYQGLYNAVTRRGEKELLPTLRKLGISLYSYSPLGAGFFASSPSLIREGKDGRFNTAEIDGLVYQAMYHRPSYMAALESWGQLAAQSGVGKMELAWRWINFHSLLQAEHGDSILVGADTAEQLELLFQWRAKGPLEAWVVNEIDGIWASCEKDAPLDCVSGWFEAVEQGRVIPPDFMKY